MKTTNILKTALVAFVLLLVLLPGSSKAQVTINPPYTITNNLSCPVKVMWSLDDSTGNPCNNSGSTALLIPAGGSIMMNPPDFAPCGGTASDVKVLLVSVNGNAVGVQASSTNTSPSIGTVSGCTSGSSTMNWTTSMCTINP